MQICTYKMCVVPTVFVHRFLQNTENGKDARTMKKQLDLLRLQLLNEFGNQNLHKNNTMENSEAYF